jgi:hypothetical protein
MKAMTIHKLYTLTVVLVVTGCVSCGTLGSKRPAQALFNGKDLSNWSAVSAKPDVKKEDVWSVRDGMIVCKGEPIGCIQTDQSFTNYKLSVDWRWAPGQAPGNSGIFLRINGQPRPLPRCIECQLKSGDAGDLYGFHGMGINGDAARRKEGDLKDLGGKYIGVKKLSGNEKPPGQWNTYQVELKGGQLTVWVNGKKLNQAFDCEVISGPIGLQSEGGEVHFRNVIVKPLD